MNYWLDLFTGTTWREYREAGAIISGFRGREATVAASECNRTILLPVNHFGFKSLPAA
jgi:hypothetical protein